MTNLTRAALGLVALACATTPAAAQTAPTTPTPPTTPSVPAAPSAPAAPAAPAAPSMPSAPAAPSAPSMPAAPATPDAPAAPSPAGGLGASASATPAPGPKKPKEHRFGDFDAGGRVRLPNGPDETGKFATFNWIAVDGRGAFYLAKTVTIDATIPIALKHPGTLMTGQTPDTFGGVMFTLDAMLPKLPKVPFVKNDTKLGLVLSGGWMRQGALLLSDKDYPLFDGPLEPGFTVGPVLQVKLSSLLDFSTTPLFVYQSGQMASEKAVQVPISLIVKLGSLVKVSADAGVFTGPGYSLAADKGGRIAAGGALDLKIGPVMAHVGAGVASLLTGGEYPTIGDSVYIDVNAKYVR